MALLSSPLLSRERRWWRRAAIALTLSATPAIAQCPIFTDSGVTYQAVLPQGR